MHFKFAVASNIFVSFARPCLRLMTENENGRDWDFGRWR